VAVALVVPAAVLVLERRGANVLPLTGIVSTDDVVVAPQVAGQVGRLLVREGDVVARGQLLAVIEPAELEADRAYFEHSAEGYASQVGQNAAALRYEERQTTAQIRQAEANLAATQAQQAEAVASFEDARLTLERQEALARGGANAAQDRDHARTAFEVARAHVASVERQVDAQQAALALALANREQIEIRRSTLQASQQQHAAADAQKTKAGVRLGYAEVRAPIPGVVDVRAVRPGEYVNPGQAIVTLIDPDDLWVRADVEETYIDRVRLGDRLTVRFPSGDEREGTVIRRGVDADFATQRDVSRTKRDIKTFAVKVALPNPNQDLFTGMTATVLLPPPEEKRHWFGG